MKDFLSLVISMGIACLKRAASHKLMHSFSTVLLDDWLLWDIKSNSTQKGYPSFKTSLIVSALLRLHCNLASASDWSCFFLFLPSPPLPFSKRWPQEHSLKTSHTLISISELAFQETQPTIPAMPTIIISPDFLGKKVSIQ